MSERINPIDCRIIKIGEATRPGAHVVAIDVIRAFTTAGMALCFGGASSITCVGSLEDARRMKLWNPDLLLMGEESGQKPDGFEFGNSPQELMLNGSGRLEGKNIVQRTSNGTKGLLQAADAAGRWGGAATNATATVEGIIASGARQVDLMVTDTKTNEDLACAEFMRDSFGGHRPDPLRLRKRILAAETEIHGVWHRKRSQQEIDAFHDDVVLAAKVDSLPVAMAGMAMSASVRLNKFVH